MKKIAACLLLGAAAASAAWADEPKASEKEGFVFTDVTAIPVTSVKDQDRSGTCWSFCATGFLENEILRQKGDSLDISEMYTVRMCYRDKAIRYVRMGGNCHFAGGGSASDVPYVWRTYGAMPEEAYPGLCYGLPSHDHSELDAVLSAYVKAVASGKKVTTAWLNGLDGILDAYLGPVPETFTYKGKTYTPKSYAQSLGINYDDYVAVTSFTHSPFYQEFVLEMPDNWLLDRYMNVPMEDMLAIVDNALEHGYTVAWAADVSEDGFKWYDGVALMPKGKDEGDMTGTELARWVKLSDRDRAADKYAFTGPVPEEEITQEMRQQLFESHQTTDDHGMVIVGKAVDQEGNPYYKVKNSWNTNQVYDGYIYVSVPYFLAKTMNIYVNKGAVPADIARRMKI